MEMVSLGVWVDALRQSDSGAAKDIAQNTAIKLLDFFDGMVSKGSDTLFEVSKNASCGALDCRNWSGLGRMAGALDETAVLLSLSSGIMLREIPGTYYEAADVRQH
jgi:hypothetical protein